MVSKKNFQQNGRSMQQRQGLRGPVPYKKPFKQNIVGAGAGGGMPQTGGNNFNQQMMFTSSQIPDNPGYMDFNNPTPPMGGSTASSNAQTQQGAIGQQQQQQKKKNNKNKQKMKQMQQTGNGNFGRNGKNSQNPSGNTRSHRFNGGGAGGGPMSHRGGGGGGFNSMLMGGFGPNRGGRRMMPPPVGGPMSRGGPMPPLPPPMHHGGFHGPMIPPMPPMGRGPMPPMGGQPPHFLRRSGRSAHPIPPPMPPMMPPRMQRGGIPPPIPFNGIGKIKKPNSKVAKKVVKGKSSIKTLKSLANQYPIDKPWVTDIIRAEHDKKVDIENRLVGNKNDELFAQFKTQRDKFVALYETAREEYLKKEAEAVKTKDAKDKQTINMTATKDGIKKEAIPNNNKNTAKKA